MQDIIAFLAALPLECIVLSVALFFIYMIAIAPVFIGIIAQRRLNAERDKPARRAVYEDGQFYDIEDDNDLIVLDYSRSTECLVTVNLPWAADPIQALVHFKVSDNPDRTGRAIKTRPRTTSGQPKTVVHTLFMFPPVCGLAVW